MGIVYESLLAIEIPAVIQRYEERDTILYALSLGMGQDPLDAAALRYCYEQDLRALPTLSVVLAHPGSWMRDLDTGIDYTKVVHGEQTLEIHQPLAAAGKVMSRSRVLDVIDKGVGRGAVVVFERRIYDAATDRLLATMTQTNICRANGGFGGPSGTSAAPPAPPRGAPEFVVDLPTRADAALLYRLCADRNPLHVDPGVARAAGFPRPILHGLATFGIVGHALLKSICNYDNERIQSMATRFSTPLFPGETVRTEMWRHGTEVRFRAVALERDVAVLSGHANLRV
jgi:acyl dehydratase